MTAHGLEMLEHTVQLTHAWIDELDTRLGWRDRHKSFRLLRAVLQTLRDCLPVNESADFAAQLPILLRGVYFEHWRPGKVKSRHDPLDRFFAKVQDFFRNDPIEDVGDAVTIVFDFFSKKISAGEIKQVIGCLPAEIRQLWVVKAHAAA